jgi:hypothetical protein
MSTDGDRAPRDIKNHLLFEIATEVAHRGTSNLPHRYCCCRKKTKKKKKKKKNKGLSFT